MQTILFGSGLALIFIFSMALTVAVIGIILWAAFRSQTPRTGRQNRRFPSTDANGTIIPGAAMYDTTNPSLTPNPDAASAPDSSHVTGHSSHSSGHSHFDSGSFGGHSHGGGFDAGGGGGGGGHSGGHGH